MSIDAQLLEAERLDREQRQRLIARYHVRDALNSLVEGHPAAAPLHEALLLLEAA